MGGSRGSYKPAAPVAMPPSAPRIDDVTAKEDEYMKSREELIGDIVGLLQSPAKSVISALQSSGGKLAGIVKTLSERPE